jgi:putative membrane protein
MRISHGRYTLYLLAVFLVFAAVLGIDPVYRKVWYVENTLVLALLAFLALTYRHLPLSRISYTLIFFFLCLHEIGGHYSYAQVPYDQFFIRLTGVSLNQLMRWDRQNYDRVVHFCYGLCFAYPIREVYLRVANARGFWGYFLPLDLTMSTSMIYEIMEWIGGEHFGGKFRSAFVAEQGDPWDSQKDMACATAGAIISILLILCTNMYLKRDFARDWVESLRVKRKRPLGEDKLIEMIEEKQDEERRAEREEPKKNGRKRRDTALRAGKA